MKTYNRDVPESVEEIGGFIAEYASWLWGCGATCLRIEKNTRRMAEAYGLDVDVTIMPKHVSVVINNRDSEPLALFNKKIHKCGINFDLNANLSALSWSVADNNLPISEAKKLFLSIVGRRYGNSLGTLGLVCLANASFCRLFGGDAVAMLLVFMTTLAGYRLKQVLLEKKVDVRVVFLLSAFLSSVLCAGGVLFGWGETPGIAFATSVLYLIPGVPYLNAVSDLLACHYLCSFSRLVDAVVLTAALSAGMCLAIGVMKLNYIW